MKNTLTLEQIKDLLRAIKMRGNKGKADFALVLSLLFCGARSRTWTWGKAASEFVTLPQDVYNALRDLATSKRLSLVITHRDLKYHWGSGLLERAIFCAANRTTPFTTAEVSRRIKRHARRAGIETPVNLRTLVNTHQSLRKQFGLADLASPFIIEGRVSTAKRLPITGAQLGRDPRLHGIGRRSGKGNRVS